jgi:hypothetical protein
MFRSVLFAFASLAVAACTHAPTLKPEADTPLAPGKKDVALTEVSGVRLSVSGGAWNGDPSNLAEVFMPVLVAIENHSGKTLRISYQDFSLVGDSGFRYVAIPPMKAKGTVNSSAERNISIQLASYPPAGPVSGLVQAQFYHDRFFIAPHYSYWYPGLAPWPYGFAYDPLYYDQFYATWPERLPTKDMINKALPEGALQDNGKVGGFIYFQGVGDRDSRVRFETNLADASNGQSFATATIPFAVSK